MALFVLNAMGYLYLLWGCCFIFHGFIRWAGCWYYRVNSVTSSLFPLRLPSQSQLLDCYTCTIVKWSFNNDWRMVVLWSVSYCFSFLHVPRECHFMLIDIYFYGVSRGVLILKGMRMSKPISCSSSKNSLRITVHDNIFLLKVY